MSFFTRQGIAVAALVFTNIFIADRISAQEGVVPPVNNPSVTADAMFMDATNARLKGDKKKAEELLLQVLKLKPTASGAYYDLARLNMPEHPDKATDFIKKAISLDDSNKWYQDQYGQILAFRNRYEDAAMVYDKLSKSEKHNEDYLMRSAMMYQRAGRNKDAIRAIDKLLEKNPGDEEIMLQKQQLYLKMNDIEGAAKVVQQMIERNPKEGRYYALLAEIYNTNKQPEKAAEVYKKAEQMFPDDPIVLFSLAQYYKTNNNQQKYKDYVKKALLNKGLDIESQLAALVAYMQDLGPDTVGREEAMDIAQQIAGQHPDNAQVLGVYADLLAMNNQRDKAIVQYKKAIAIDQSRYALWQNLLYSYTGREDSDSLIYYSEKAMRLFPNQAMIHYLNGVAYTNKRNYPKAISSINRAIDMQPEENAQLLADMYTALGDAYHSSGQHNLSDSSYERALRLDPDNASVLNNYSYYLSVRGERLDDAEKMSRKSLEVRPNEGTFLDTYGWILYKREEYKKAKEYIQKAIDATPNADGTLFEHMGDVYFKLKDVDKAVEYWKKAKEKGTDDEQKITKKIQDRKLYE